MSISSNICLRESQFCVMTATWGWGDKFKGKSQSRLLSWGMLVTAGPVNIINSIANEEDICVQNNISQEQRRKYTEMYKKCIATKQNIFQYWKKIYVQHHTLQIQNRKNHWDNTHINLQGTLIHVDTIVVKNLCRNTDLYQPWLIVWIKNVIDKLWWNI